VTEEIWVPAAAGRNELTHRLATGRAPDRLLPRLDENERVLVATHDLVTAAVRGDRRISPAAEWLLDNFYLVEEQIRTARRHLPRSYGRDLPRLAGGPSVGYPRVYAIALALIAHRDRRVDTASLNAFVGAYQAVAPLTLGELWAVPIVLRLALIENLRRVATRIGATRRGRDAAVDWAARMVAAVEAAPTDLILVMADMARADAPLSGAFLAELTRQLQGQSPHLAFATTWLEHRLADQGLTIEQLVRAEGNAQAADQVSVGNSITSLRFLSSTDWREFVEGHSVVERELRADPAGAYAGMAFATRDRYRHAVERVARRSGKVEADVARQAIGLARASGAAGAGRAGHVGYYLIDRGRPALERLAEMRRSPATLAAAAALRRFPLLIYLGGIALISAAVLWGAGYAAARAGLGWLPMWLLALPATIAATQVATAVVNWLVTRFVAPRPLPRLDFRLGVPPEHRTLVVVPTMLTSADGVQQSLVEGLEVRYLANAEANLHFGLLTDWLDAAEERSDADDELLRLARAGIEQLNEKYRARRPGLFFLFHRARRWNAADRVWMGYERKRGKLADLNAFLRGATDRFTAVEGEAGVLAGVRYVVTLDTDTQLPRGAAAEMAGAMAHPLNRPVFDAACGRVVAGHASKTRRGTASGTAAPTSTTAARSGRRPAPSARSTRSRRVGPSCRARATRSARASRWRTSTPASSTGPAGSSACSTRRSTSPTSTPGTSRGTSPASARTAASTRTPRSGPPWRSPRWASASTRGRCTRSSTRSATRRPRRAPPCTAPSRTSSPPTCTASPRTPAAAGGPGTPARPGGCTA